MPCYSFKCPVCHLSFDVLKPINRVDEVQECPSCDYKETIKQVSAPSFVINGSSSKNNFEG